MKKEQMLNHWKGLKETDLSMTPVAYKHKGSTYDEDGIRITGDQVFIDAVLYRLRDLLDYENGSTRLQVVYKETIDRESGVNTGTHNCYIQVHERGREAQIMNAICEGARQRQLSRA